MRIATSRIARDSLLSRFVACPWVRGTHGGAAALALIAWLYVGHGDGGPSPERVGLRTALAVTVAAPGVGESGRAGANPGFDGAVPTGGLDEQVARALRGWNASTRIAEPPQDEPPLSDEMQRVRDWVARRYRVSGEELAPVLVEAENSARSAGLDPLLIVAMMAVESSFNPLAESKMGARGLMQVIPRWHMDKIGEGAHEDVLFDPVVNVQVGTQVLVEGLQRYGSLQAALQYYNGARSDPEARYTKKVLSIKRQLASVARVEDDA